MIERLQPQMPEDPRVTHIRGAAQVLLVRYGFITPDSVKLGRPEGTDVGVKRKCAIVSGRLKTDLSEEFGIRSQVASTANFSPSHYYLVFPEETPHPPEEDLLLDPAINQNILGQFMFLGKRKELHAFVVAHPRLLITEIKDPELFFDIIWGKSSYLRPEPTEK